MSNPTQTNPTQTTSTQTTQTAALAKTTQKSTVYRPRPYQSDCIAALAEARNNGVKKGLVVMASGLGKTLTTVFDLQQFLGEHPSARVLCLCHQESILLQSKEKFRKVFGEEYSYGMFTGNYKTTHPVSFLFATFQTMRDHREEFPPDAFDYIVVDEAHHTAAETYQPTADYFVPQFLLGLTATKDRMDGRNILDTYEQVLYQMDIYDGWTEGWLARVDYRIMLDDLNEEEFKKYVGPHATGEKVSLSQLNKTIFAPQHDEGIVASIREQIADMDNPSIFIFCSGIDHANAMAHQFGGEAAVIHSGQSAGLNEAILSEFRSGGIRIIVSVDMLNEGIDVPEADVVVFLRATESSTIFFQQLGRGLRISGEKRTVRVLDYVANIERIVTILEMEETARQRIPTSPTYSPSANKPEPLVVNIPATKFKVQRIDIEQLVRRCQKMQDDEIVVNYAELVKRIGGDRLPTVLEIDEDPLLPSYKTVCYRFGTHKNLACLAGYAHLINTSDEEYQYGLQLLHDKWVRDKKVPTAASVDNDKSLPCYGTYVRRYGNFTRALVLASIPITSGLEKLQPSDVPILKQTYIGVVQAAAKSGKRASYADLCKNKNAVLGEKVVQELFGSFSSLLSAAGLDPNRKSSTDAWSKQELIQFLQDNASPDGYAPTREELRKIKNSPALTRYQKEFGNYRKAVAAAGLQNRKGGKRK